jgi:choline dehydrogenase-like flavoprotein
MLAWSYRTTDRLIMKMRCVVEKFAPSHPASDSQNDMEEWCKRQWHVLGSAKMGKPEEGGVVNEKLEVHGVKDLMVCDLSVCPGMVGANTYNTALVVVRRRRI